MPNTNATPFFHWLTLVATTLCLLVLITQAGPVNGSASAEMTGATYYVSPDGSDSNPGTADRPWKTIGKAANTLRAGQTVLIRAGTYRERVLPLNSGSAGQEIVYAAYTGETPVLDGSTIPLPSSISGLFEISGKSYIRLSGLTVTNARPYAEDTAVLVQNSSYITVEKVHASASTGSGILVWNSSNVIVSGSTVERSNSLRLHECLSIGRTSNFEVMDNTVFNCSMEGIDVKDGSHDGSVHNNHVYNVTQTGIYADAWDQHTYNLSIYNNLVHNTSNYGIEVASERGGLLENVFIYTNMVAHNKYSGMMVSDNKKGEILSNIQIVNNTFANNGDNGIWVDNANARGVLIRNNIVSKNSNYQIVVTLNKVPAQNVTIDHNLVDRNNNKMGPGETFGTNYVPGDPKFGGAVANNYHILSGSPALNKGVDVSNLLTTDYDGEPRPMQGGWDIGADELGVYPYKEYIPWGKR